MELDLLAFPVAHHKIVRLDDQGNVIVSYETDALPDETIARFFCTDGKLYLQRTKKSEQGEKNVRCCVLRVTVINQESAGNPQQKPKLIALTKIPSEKKPWKFWSKNLVPKTAKPMVERHGNKQNQIIARIKSLPVETDQKLRLEYCLKNYGGKNYGDGVFTFKFCSNTKHNRSPDLFGLEECLRFTGFVETFIPSGSENKSAEITVELNWDPKCLDVNNVIAHKTPHDCRNQSCTKSAVKARTKEVKDEINRTIKRILDARKIQGDEKRNNERDKLKKQSVEDIKIEADKLEKGKTKTKLCQLADLKTLQKDIETVKDIVKNLEIHLRLQRVVETENNEKLWVNLYEVGSP